MAILLDSKDEDPWPSGTDLNSGQQWQWHSRDEENHFDRWFDPEYASSMCAGRSSDSRYKSF